MSSPHHETPYRDDVPPARSSSHRSTSTAKSSSSPRRKAATHSSRPVASPSGRKPRVHASNGAAKPVERLAPGSRRGRRRGSAYNADNALTSQPTGRAAILDTRAWLLAQHGPVCAYCGVKFSARVMTLDHVAPRRGQTAYDRRDNLVLACPGCNMAKRDQSPLAFLLAVRSRAVNLSRYGSHLSQMLVDLAKSLVPVESIPRRNGAAKNGNGHSPDEPSPYSDL